MTDVVAKTGSWRDDVVPGATHPLREGTRNPKYGQFREGIEPAVSWGDLSPQEDEIVPVPENVLKYDEDVPDDVAVVPVPQTRKSRARAE